MYQAEDVDSSLERGFSLVFNRLHERCRSIAALCDELSTLFGGAVMCGANAYLTPRARSAFALHHDSQDAFVIQILVRKLNFLIAISDNNERRDEKLGEYATHFPSLRQSCSSTNRSRHRTSSPTSSAALCTWRRATRFTCRAACCTKRSRSTSAHCTSRWASRRRLSQWRDAWRCIGRSTTTTTTTTIRLVTLGCEWFDGRLINTSRCVAR